MPGQPFQAGATMLTRCWKLVLALVRLTLFGREISPYELSDKSTNDSCRARIPEESGPNSDSKYHILVTNVKQEPSTLGGFDHLETYVYLVSGPREALGANSTD